jgi:hypothetical protein
VIKHPTTNFTVILSISHGPGTSTWPVGEYIAPIKKLNVYGNVQTIGYIDTEHGTRDNVTVRQEIATYAGWNKSGIAIHGIYFDRTPAKDVGDAQSYLQNVSAAVRAEEGFLEPRLVVHCPGEVPDAGLARDGADVVVAFEGEYGELPRRKVVHGKLEGLQGGRERYAYIVHSLPESVGRGGVRRVVDGVRRDVGSIFVTDRRGEDRYEGFSARWEEFLDLIW